MHREMVDTKRKKMLPIGIEDFTEIRTEGFYYVDKTAMIRDLLRRYRSKICGEKTNGRGMQGSNRSD